MPTLSPVPAIVVSSPTIPEPPSNRNSLVDRVTGTLGLGTIRGKRPFSPPATATSASFSISDIGRPRSSTFSSRPSTYGTYGRSTLSGSASGPTAFLLNPTDAYARPLPRRARHSISLVSTPAPTLPELQLGVPFRPTQVGLSRQLDHPSPPRLPSAFHSSPFTRTASDPLSETATHRFGAPSTIDDLFSSPSPSPPISSPSAPSSLPSAVATTELPLLSPTRSPSRAGSLYPTLSAKPSRESIFSTHTVRRKPVVLTIVDKINAEKHLNIVENILKDISPGQLASLRKVSGGFRDWVDRFLCYHIVVESYCSSSTSHVSFTILRVNGKQHDHIGSRRLVNNEPLERIHPNVIPRRILARTRCLELRGPLGRTDVAEFSECLLNLQTVRLCENGLGLFPDSCPFVVENIVATLTHDHDPLHARLRRGSIEDDDRWALPEGVKRLLLNVRVDGMFPAGRVRPFAYPSTLTEVNIRFVGEVPAALSTGMLHVRPFDFLFQQIGPIRANLKYAFIDALNLEVLWTLPKGPVMPAVKKSPGFLQRTVRRIGGSGNLKKADSQRDRLNIVHVDYAAARGGSSVPKLQVGAMHNAKRAAADAALQSFLRDAVRTHQKRWKLAAPAPELVSRMSFLSLAEYRRRVPAQQFVMETE